MKQELIEISIQNKDPKQHGVKSHEIATIQDIADCVDSDNLDGFMIDLKAIIQSFILVKSIDKNVTLESFVWTDDHKTK